MFEAFKHNIILTTKLYMVSSCHSKKDWVLLTIIYLTIRLRAQVIYQQIVNEAQPSWLSLVENEGG